MPSGLDVLESDDQVNPDGFAEPTLEGDCRNQCSQKDCEVDSKDASFSQTVSWKVGKWRQTFD